MKIPSNKLSFLMMANLIILGGCGGGSETEIVEEPASDPVTVVSPDLNISFSQTPMSETISAFANFSFSATDASSYECQLDNKPFEVCSSPRFLFPVLEGAHQFSVRALDTNGDAGESLTYNWDVQNVFTQQHEDLIVTNVQPEIVVETGWRGIFRINCDFSHSSYNDPIVFPGQENAAHLHRFYGNTLVDHQTGDESLLTTGESSCQGNQLNLTSYWLPALLAPKYNEAGQRETDAQGEPAWHAVPAVVGNDDEAHEIFYYSAGIDDLDAIQPLPVGLRIIAGNHMGNINQQQDTSIVRWHCQSWESSDGDNPNFSTSIPECLAPDRLRLDIFFPSCWNGVDLDSADHKSHMAYPVNDGGPNGTHCPDTHPVPVVRPSYHYAFGVKPEVYDPQTRTSKGWRIASDNYVVDANTPGGMSLHGDWFNGWHPTIMQALLDNCIKQQLDCHDGNLANGFRLSGTRPGTQLEPEVINRGLGL